MDLTTCFSNYQQSQVRGQVQTSVAAKALDVQRAQGQAAIQLIEAASQIASPTGRESTAALNGIGAAVDVRG